VRLCRGLVVAWAGQVRDAPRAQAAGDPDNETIRNSMPDRNPYLMQQVPLKPCPYLFSP